MNYCIIVNLLCCIVFLPCIGMEVVEAPGGNVEGGGITNVVEPRSLLEICACAVVPVLLKDCVDPGDVWQKLALLRGGCDLRDNFVYTALRYDHNTVIKCIIPQQEYYEVAYNILVAEQMVVAKKRAILEALINNKEDDDNVKQIMLFFLKWGLPRMIFEEKQEFVPALNVLAYDAATEVWWDDFSSSVSALEFLLAKGVHPYLNVADKNKRNLNDSSLNEETHVVHELLQKFIDQESGDRIIKKIKILIDAGIPLDVKSDVGGMTPLEYVEKILQSRSYTSQRWREFNVWRIDFYEGLLSMFRSADNKKKCDIALRACAKHRSMHISAVPDAIKGRIYNFVMKNEERKS